MCLHVYKFNKLSYLKHLLGERNFSKKCIHLYYNALLKVNVMTYESGSTVEWEDESHQRNIPVEDLIYYRKHRPKHESNIQTYLFSACACDELFYLHIWAAVFHSWIMNSWHDQDSFQNLSDDSGESWPAKIPIK